MGRFSYEDADNYGNSSAKSSYFSLKDDRDTARVRIMYESAEDIEGYAVHEVEVNDKKRYVNCLRDYNSPMDDCPFCANKRYQLAKLYIPLYNLDTEEIQFWERGKKFISKMSSTCSHYPNLVGRVTEIERRGKKGDTDTTYELYPSDNDGTKLADLPEIPNVLGTIILDKSYEEMQYYIENNCFPADGNVSRNRADATESRVMGRRTPASSGRDVY